MSTVGAPEPPTEYTGSDIARHARALVTDEGELIVTDPLGRGAAFDADSNQWHALVAQNDGPPLDGLSDLETVWDGAHLIVWRPKKTTPPDYSTCDHPGCDLQPTVEQVANGWIYTPSW